MGAIGRRVGSMVAIPLSLFVCPGAEVATQSLLGLRVNVYDYARVAPDVRVAAARAISRIYASIGIEFSWVDRCPVACQIAFSREAHDDITRGHLMVTILPEAMTSREFPAAALGTAPEHGDVAYAFFDRISSVAFDRELPLSTLLGHVIAHEVGHILLREGHAAEGLMRAEWMDRDLLYAARGRLGFTATQGRRIRSRLGSGTPCT